MSSRIGDRALVVGAGIGGLTAARVLADYFAQVLIFERDTLPSEANPRSGVPQGKHVHVLLAGGQQAICELFPDFERTLIDTGAVPLRVGLDVLMERPNYDPYPQRDLGFSSYAQSRPQLELNLRQHVLTHANIELLPRCRVQRFVANEAGTAVNGLVYAKEDGGQETVAADLIIDASGRGSLTLALLDALGLEAPEATTIGVDIAYATVVFAMPENVPPHWKAVFTFPSPPEGSRAGLLMPIEGQRWLLSLGGRRGEEPPGDIDGFMTFARQLRTPTIYNAIKDANPLSDVACFRFPESIYRHFDRLMKFPRGLLPLGDAFCRFNPVYGQGMSVAVLEARALGRLLSYRVTTAEPLAGLADEFFAQARLIIETPWTSAALPDFIYPDTRGERPADFRQQLQAAIAMTQLAAQDPVVHQLVAEVTHLLRPHSVYQDPELMQRLRAMMANV